MPSRTREAKTSSLQTSKETGICRKQLLFWSRGRAQRWTSWSYQKPLKFEDSKSPGPSLCISSERRYLLQHKAKENWNVKHHQEKWHLTNPSSALGRGIMWPKRSCPLCRHLAPPRSTSKMLEAISTKWDMDAVLARVHPPAKVTEKSFTGWTQVSFAGAVLIMHGFPTHRW